MVQQNYDKNRARASPARLCRPDFRFCRLPIGAGRRHTGTGGRQNGRSVPAVSARPRECRQPGRHAFSFVPFSLRIRLLRFLQQVEA